MYAILIIIHVIVSIFLIAVILLQAGRGGGLADSFGGSQMQNLFGTKSTNVLTKMTAGCAVMFIITCLSLAIISSRRSKPLMEKIAIPDVRVEEVTEEEVVDVETEEERSIAEEELAPAAEPEETETPELEEIQEDTDNVETE